MISAAPEADDTPLILFILVEIEPSEVSEDEALSSPAIFDEKPLTGWIDVCWGRAAGREAASSSIILTTSWPTCRPEDVECCCLNCGSGTKYKTVGRSLLITVIGASHVPHLKKGIHCLTADRFEFTCWEKDAWFKG